jgi:Septum formation
MIAPTGVNDGSSAEPAHQEPPEPPEPLTPTAAVAAQAADADPSAAETAGPQLAAAGSPTAEPMGTELAAGELPRTGPVAAEPTWTMPAVAEQTWTMPAVAEPVTTEWVEPAGPGPGPGHGQGPGRERERRRGRGLGIAAFVLVVIVLVGAAVGGLAKVTHGFHRKTKVTYRPAAVFRLRPGECVNVGPNGLSVTVLSCATPHDAEVFATFPLPASPWPGGAAVQQDASNGCASRLGGYLNPQLADAGLDQEFFYPDQEAWQAGARTVVCEVRAPTGQLTGSVRDVS